MKSAELIADRIAGLEASVEFFSQKRKVEREVWIATEFLRNLHLRFKVEDVRSVKDEPPDVLFRNANFEVVELLDPGRKRHQEYKAQLKKARNATHPSELVTMFTPVDIQIADLYEKCVALAETKAKKYAPAVRSGLDLLVYANLTRIWDVIGKEFPDPKELRNQGWRSVSFVKGNRSACFMARKDAPPFIQKALGRTTHRWNMRRGV